MQKDIFESVKDFLQGDSFSTEYTDKEYLGKTEKDEFLYMVNKGDEYAVLDAEGNELISSGSTDPEVDDEINIKEFLERAINELHIEVVDISIVDKYLTVEEEVIEEEPVIDSPEAVLPAEPEEPEFNPISKEQDAGELSIDDEEEEIVDDEESDEEEETKEVK